MGSLCSKQRHLSGGDRLLSTPDAANQQSSERPDPRTAAAQAAEERLKASQSRGVVSSNPKSGRLAAQLDASKSAPKGLAPEPRQQEQLVWD